MVRELASARTWEKVVYLYRHGETDDNIRPVFQSPDTPLSERGRSQAYALAGRMTKVRIEALVCSSLARARETVAPMAATGIPCVFSELFVERIKPEWLNGRSYSEPAADEMWQAWTESLYTSGLRVDDGENFDDIVARADYALAFLQDRPEREIGVMTHGFFLRVMLARVLMGNLLTGPLLRQFETHAEMQNTGITVLRFRSSGTPSGWNLWTYNDHSHLM